MRLRPSEARNLAGQDTGRRELHQSEIDVLLACPRKYDLRHRQGLELIERPRALSLGGAYQKAIEHQDPEVGIHALRGEERCDICGGEGVVQDPEDVGPGPLVSTIACEECGGDGWNAGESDAVRYAYNYDRLIVDEAIVEAASKLYLSKWPGGPGETREFEFKVRLRNPSTGGYSSTFDLAGKADGVVDEWAYDNPLLKVDVPIELIENKLVGQITDQKVQRLPLDRQVAIYRYGIWRATGRKVETVRYRWMRKPQIRQRKNETIEEYADRIRQDYEDRPDFYYHEEEPQFATTGDLLRVEAELWDDHLEILAREKRPIWRRNTSACGDYGGCPYIPVCTGDPDAMSLYRQADDRR